jgi:predicted RNA-binding protein YlxR (DUF448 family)
MKWVLVVFVFLVGCVGLVYLGYLQGREAYVAGYNQGYKDALYKRPVSNDLEMVCAGLWFGKETEKYVKEEEQRGKR